MKLPNDRFLGSMVSSELGKEALLLFEGEGNILNPLSSNSIH